jgi:hypothetical protein
MTLITLMPLPNFIVRSHSHAVGQEKLTCKQTSDPACSPQVFASIDQSSYTLSAGLYRSATLCSLHCIVCVGRLSNKVDFESIKWRSDCTRGNATHSTRDKIAYIGHKIRQFELPSRRLDWDVWVSFQAHFLVLDIMEPCRCQLRRLRSVCDHSTGGLCWRKLLVGGI